MTSETAIAGIGERIPRFRPDVATVFFRVLPAENRIVWLSGEPERLLGYDRELWHAPDFLAERVFQKDRAAVRWMQAWEPGVLEARMVHDNGSVVWVERTLRVRDDGSDEMDGLLIDIDARVIQDNSASRTVNSMREALVVTAQELARPVNAMSDFGSLLERHLATQNDDLGSDYALGIRDGVERLKTLTNRLTAAARQGGGR